MAELGSGVRRVIPVYLFTLVWVISWSISVSGPVLPLYIRSLGIEITQWGLLVMAHAVGMVLLEWFWGALSDRVDRRIFMVLSMLGMSVIFPLYTVRDLIPYFAALQFLLGALAVIMGPISRALVLDFSPAGSIGMSMSLWEVIMTTGHMVGSIIGSFVAQVWSFELSFYLSSILSLMGGFAVLITLQRGWKHRSRAVREDSGIMKGLNTISSRPFIRILFAVAVTSFMARSVLWALLPLYASEEIGMSTVEVGMLSAVMSFTQLVAAPLFGRMSQRFNKRRLVATAFAVTSLSLFLFYFVETYLQLFAVSIGVSICLSASPLLLAMLSEATPRRLLGLSMGVYGSFEDIGIMIGPPIYSLLWSIYSPGSAFLAGAAVQSISLLLISIAEIEPMED